MGSNDKDYDADNMLNRKDIGGRDPMVMNILAEAVVGSGLGTLMASGRGFSAKYQSPKETVNEKYTDKPYRQTNTQLPTGIARISKSNT